MSDKTVTVNIVSRWDSNKVLFSAEVDASIGERYRLRAALEIGVNRGANLRGADLRYAYLRGANLRYANLSGADLRYANLSGADLRYADLSGAYLSGAYLRGANLGGAYLSGANLSGANLSGADLSGANLRYAYLSGADLSGANLGGADLSGANLGGADLSGADLSGADLREGLKLVGDRPYFQLGPIGSESRTFEAFITDQGPRLRAGCFFGTRDEFVAKLNQTHGNNIHAREYTAALSLIDAHCELWTPETESKEAV